MFHSPLIYGSAVGADIGREFSRQIDVSLERHELALEVKTTGAVRTFGQSVNLFANIIHALFELQLCLQSFYI
jgi:hypothetical protein